MVQRGVGEILLNSIDGGGTMSGYDRDLISMAAEEVDVPVVAVGGAGELRRFREAVDRGASAVSAGSLFVFHGRHRAVLIIYLKYADLEKLFSP